MQQYTKCNDGVMQTNRAGCKNLLFNNFELQVSVNQKLQPTLHSVWL